MSSYPGFKIMMDELFGMYTKDEAIRLLSFRGKTLKDLKLSNHVLHLTFTDDTRLRIWDDGQSCCEQRYMSTDDNLAYHIGAEFREVQLRAAPPVVDEYDNYHEVQFMEIHTSKGVLSFANHNEHNGYYGGFSVRMKEETIS